MGGGFCVRTLNHCGSVHYGCKNQKRRDPLRASMAPSEPLTGITACRDTDLNTVLAVFHTGHLIYQLAVIHGHWFFYIIADGMNTTS